MIFKFEIDVVWTIKMYEISKVKCSSFYDLRKYLIEYYLIFYEIVHI